MVVTAALASPVDLDRQAVGGTDCEQAYQGYIGGTDLNPPAIPAIKFYDARRHINLITLQCGVNGFIHGRTATQEFTSITNFVTAAKATGFTVIVATLTDSSFISNGGGETTYRAALNTAITGGAVGQGYTVADYAANAFIGCDGCYSNTTYFTDGVHLTTAGIAIQATIMEAAMAAISFP